jgi:hypothetical protein
MKKVKAYQNGELKSLIRAEAVTEDTRRAFDFRCIENGCDCSMHWRKAVYAKGNTDPIAPTFVKNKSSSHMEGCAGDLERIVRENIEYTTIKNGQVHVRLNFPLGSAPVDRFPLRGWLTEQQLKAAENRKDIKPYSSLKDLVKFLEKNFYKIDSDAAAEVVVNYQGKSIEWGKLFKGSDQYDKLFYRATKDKASPDDPTQPIVTIVRPLKEIDRNKGGKARFECEEQHVKILGRKQKVVPVIVCDGHDHLLEQKMRNALQNNSTMIVTSRPFYPGSESMPSRFGTQRISLFVHKTEQVEPVASSYWKVSHKPENQLKLFPEDKPQLGA